MLDGTQICGFVCEGYGVHGASDITSYGGWRSYLESPVQTPA
jgi:hypothetical protein